MSRLAVPKTYKLYVGGAFVRSESGRYDRHGERNVPRASRKDVRDAVKAARAAAGPWAARTPYNRGQIIYRAAEALESRAADLAVEREEVEAAIDVLVHYAGWTDKLAPVLGGVNPVAAPFLSFSLPEPTGVVGVVAPDAPPLLGLVAELAPALAAGNTVVAVLSEGCAARRLGPRRGARRVGRAGRGREPAVRAAGRARRGARRAPGARRGGRRRGATRSSARRSTGWRPRASPACGTRDPTPDYAAAVADALTRLEAVTEIKTAWHPVGA